MYQVCTLTLRTCNLLSECIYGYGKAKNNTFPVSNSAPCYEDMRGSACVTSLRWMWHYCAVSGWLNTSTTLLCSEWLASHLNHITVQWVASLTPQPLYHPEGWVGSITGLGIVARRKISALVRNQAPVLCRSGTLLTSSLTAILWHSAKHWFLLLHATSTGGTIECFFIWLKALTACRTFCFVCY